MELFAKTFNDNCYEGMKVVKGVEKSKSVIRAFSNFYDRAFYENICRLLAGNYFRKLFPSSGP